ncbi:MAG: PIN domain nuclease [Dethiobacter sp.]|jgi:predicted nucleic acid-binding protein|nr:PIN domain nuclease [Dethiobacter sp.]MBS3901119.1 PIN domain nuclease [Dethiobacter sp.]MBS3990073.1 PIN domain nuclease [Dethiobacter sp.]
MILVDTSVLIGFLKGQDNDRTELFKEILSRDIPFGISSYTYQEVLQGTRNEEEFQTLKDYLSTQHIYFLEQGAATYERAAKLYFNMRRKGITPRSTLDILIALTAIDNDLALLHNDSDFNAMADHMPDFRILNML